jgi:hypothetical protein
MDFTYLLQMNFKKVNEIPKAVLWQQVLQNEIYL